MELAAKRPWSPETADYNRAICAAATHAILLAPTEAAMQPWREFCRETRVIILAELTSDYHATSDSVNEGEPFRARIHHLERGDLRTPRPAVDALAQRLVWQRLVEALRQPN